MTNTTKQELIDWENCQVFLSQEQIIQMIITQEEEKLLNSKHTKMNLPMWDCKCNECKLLRLNRN